MDTGAGNLKTGKEKTMTLKNTLRDLIAQAESEYPRGVKIALPGELTINLRKALKDEDTYEYVLTIWRYNVYPSLTEWQVICHNFPYPIRQALIPEKGIILKKHYLKGTVPLPRPSTPG
jgi:hypothetical protein